MSIAPYIADAFFAVSNYAEAVLWGVVGIAFLVAAVIPRNRSNRAACLIAAAAFLLFGVSDVVEASTGAWWRPWWLLVWKGGCIAIFAALLWRYVRKQRGCVVSRDEDRGDAESAEDAE